MATRLSNDKLAELPESIVTPTYDRGALRPGILHVGLGNFHRAHQAVYCDELLAAGGDPAWGILGAGVMPADEAMREDLLAQDCLFSVTQQDAAGEQVRVIGAMCGFLPVETGHAPVLAAMQDPAVRIVSLTVTEGGYFVSTETGGFNPDHPQIRADIAQPDQPTTIFGTLVAGLRARRDSGASPFTVLSCDNLPHNGDVTRAAVLGIARAQDQRLADWIADNVAFPNGMVDRITPATTTARATHLRDTFQIDDARPVFCEPFRQWVLEDSFCNGRPALEKVGVQFVPDVTPYEHMKIRMLNGGHALIAYPAALMGLTFAHETMAHPLISAYFDKVERDEIHPVVDDVPGATQQEYHALLRERLSNPRIEDTIARLCFDGSNRQPKFIVPSVLDNRKAGRVVPGLALESALWCRYCFGVNDAGQQIAPNDPDWERLHTRARQAREDPSVWLEMRDIYGALADDVHFRDSFAAALIGLHRNGTEQVLRDYLS